jgi:transposase
MPPQVLAFSSGRRRRQPHACAWRPRRDLQIRLVSKSKAVELLGSDATSGSLLSYVDLEARVPTTHPLRVIKAIVDDVLVALDVEFESLNDGSSRPSIAPERLLRASVL